MFIGNAYPEELARLISATGSLNMGHCQDRRFNLLIVHFSRFFDFWRIRRLLIVTPILWRSV